MVTNNHQLQKKKLSPYIKSKLISSPISQPKIPNVIDWAKHPAHGPDAYRGSRIAIETVVDGPRYIWSIKKLCPTQLAGIQTRIYLIARNFYLWYTIEFNKMMMKHWHWKDVGDLHNAYEFNFLMWVPQDQNEPSIPKRKWKAPRRY